METSSELLPLSPEIAGPLIDNLLIFKDYRVLTDLPAQVADVALQRGNFPVPWFCQNYLGGHTPANERAVLDALKPVNHIFKGYGGVLIARCGENVHYKTIWTHTVENHQTDYAPAEFELPDGTVLKGYTAKAAELLLKSDKDSLTKEEITQFITGSDDAMAPMWAMTALKGVQKITGSNLIYDRKLKVYRRVQKPKAQFFDDYEDTAAGA